MVEMCKGAFVADAAEKPFDQYDEMSEMQRGKTRKEKRQQRKRIQKRGIEMKRFLSSLLALLVLLTSLGLTAFAAGIKDGCEAYVLVGSINVTQNPSVSSRSIAALYKGERVTVLEAYLNGIDQKTENFHKVQLDDGKIGYLYAYASRKDTLESADDVNERYAEAAKTADPKYQHAINMYVLSDYIYGGKKTTEGKELNFYAKVPTEWVRHERPESLPLVGKGILHIGDEGKIGSVKASFYPGNPPINYHSKRLDELKVIGYDPPFAENSRTEANANTAFYAGVGSVFDVVAYNENWVAVWSMGGVDESRGTIRQCGEKDGTAFTSWKPAVYFVPRKNCYILDINNQVTTPPQIEAIGKVTAPLLVKTTPDETDFVKSGVYKINQSVQIVDSQPQNGHYKIYYEHGLYYVNAKYVNIQYTNTPKPSITYTAKANAESDILDGASVVGAVKQGTVIDVMEKDYDGTNSKIWFNSKECYIPTSKLSDFIKTPSASGIAQLGAPIGVLAVDSPWSAYGALAYTKDGYEALKEEMYNNPYYVSGTLKHHTDSDELSILQEGDWANVYKIEDYSYAPDPDYPDEIETGKVYTVLYDGNVRYIVQDDEQYAAFNYYPGNDFSKTSVAKTQPVCIEGNRYNAVAYNIDDNNYFKLRDIAQMLSGTIKTFDIKYDAATNSIDMLSFFDYTSAGGELTPGDGAERKAVSSSAFLTLDGVPIQATCYNIDGNNYFKLRDITDALDCRVDWEKANQTIWVIPGMSAYDDPDAIVG